MEIYWAGLHPSSLDGFAKSPKSPFSVIPAEAGIQC